MAAATAKEATATAAIGGFGSHGPLLPIEALFALIDQRFAPVAGQETVALGAARGRILAANQVAAMAVPAFDSSAVDGWAVRGADLSTAADSRLPIGGRIAAGHPLATVVQPGFAYRIFTGGALPAGLDTIVMQEDSRLDGDQVVLPPTRPGSNRRRAGDSVAQGSVPLAAGQRLRAQEIGVAASLGLATLPVYRRLRVAVFSTGDEVTLPGAPLAPGCVFDANRYTLAALLDGLGCAVSDLGIIPDRPQAVRAVLREAAAAHHLLLTSGGVSVGEEDHMRAAVAELGQLDLWRFAVKPGRPLAFGRIGDVPFLGLPGNPVAVMVTFLLFARRLIDRLSGAAASPLPTYRVTAAFALHRNGPRREFARARLVEAADGPQVVLLPNDSSGALTSMTEADGLVDLPQGELAIEPGDPVSFLPFAGLLP